VLPEATTLNREQDFALAPNSDAVAAGVPPTGPPEEAPVSKDDEEEDQRLLSKATEPESRTGIGDEETTMVKGSKEEESEEDGVEVPRMAISEIAFSDAVVTDEVIVEENEVIEETEEQDCAKVAEASGKIDSSDASLASLERTAQADEKEEEQEEEEQEEEEHQATEEEEEEKDCVKVARARRNVSVASLKQTALFDEKEQAATEEEEEAIAEASKANSEMDSPDDLVTSLQRTIQADEKEPEATEAEEGTEAPGTAYSNRDSSDTSLASLERTVPVEVNGGAEEDYLNSGMDSGASTKVLERGARAKLNQDEENENTEEGAEASDANVEVESTSSEQSTDAKAAATNIVDDGPSEATPDDNDGHNAFERRESEETAEITAPVSSLAQRMKQMFDSAAPGEPSNAFGKTIFATGRSSAASSLSGSSIEMMGDIPETRKGNNTFVAVFPKCTDGGDCDAAAGTFTKSPPPSPISSKRSSSLANNMKTMFDSSSPDEPSMAFGSGKGTFATPQLHGNAGGEPTKDDPRATPMATTPKLASPANQMVSLLWASSSAPRKKLHPASNNDESQAHEKKEEHSSLKQQHAVETTFFREEEVVFETVIEEEAEDIDEVTEDEFSDDWDDIYKGDIEIIEEVVIEDMSLTTADDVFETSTSCIELSTEFIDTIETEVDHDGRSYDEITADDDSEYEENTINDGDDRLELIQNNGVGVESKEIETVENDEPNTNSHKIENISSQTTVPSKREWVATGGLAEKLKLFDSPKSKLDRMQGIMPDQKHAIAFRQSRRSPKPAIKEESWMGDELANTTTKNPERIRTMPVPVLPVVGPMAEQAHPPDETAPAVSANVIGTDEALVDEIVSLVQKPGAMKNKKALANRIVCLLVGKKAKEGPPQDPTARTSFSLNSAASEPGERLSPVSRRRAVEANAYANRKTDGFRDPGLKQMRENVELQKGKLHHVDDPDSILNRRLKRLNLGHWKGDKASKEAPAVFPPLDDTKPSDEAAKEAPPSAQPIAVFDQKPKGVDAEEIMARIWPKTPDGAKRKPKFRSPASGNQRTAPKKLGDRLKIFESSSSSLSSPSCSVSPPPQSPRRSNGVEEKDETSAVGDLHEGDVPCDATPKTSNSTGLSIETSGTNGKATALGMHECPTDATRRIQSQKVDKDTLRALSSFKRMWQVRKRKRDTATETKKRDAAKTDTVVASSPKEKAKALFFPADSDGKTLGTATSISNQPIPDRSCGHGTTTNSNAIHGRACGRETKNNKTLPVLSDLSNAPAAAPASPTKIAAKASSFVTTSQSGDAPVGYYILEDFESGSFDTTIVDMEQWESFLTDSEFSKHFDLSKDEFYQQPRWKRDKLKRKVRVSF